MKKMEDINENDFEALFSDIFDMENFIELEETETTELTTTNLGGVNEYEPNNATSKTVSKVKSTSEVCRFRTVDIDTFLTENQNQNTQKKTEQDMKTFNSFLSFKKESRLVQFIPPDTLNEYICEFEFLLSVTKRNGQEYEPSTLRGFLCSIDRHLKQYNSKMCIATDRDFQRARDVLKSKQKDLKKQGLGNKPKTAQALSDEHLEMMYKAQTLGDYSARSLSHSMWYICVTYFGMRTGAEIHNMKWGDVSLEIDPCSGRQYVMLCKERQTKTRTGANARDTRTNQPKAYAIPDDPQRDPVHLYTTYRDRRPIEMLAEDSPFFLSTCTPVQKGWYKKTPLGVNKLYNVMNELKVDAGIEEARITPYSVRKRMVQKLNDEGVPANQIVQISGHKNINSINNYSKLNNQQSMAISDILSDSNSKSMVPTAPPATAATNSFEMAPGRGFFMNSHFHGNVVFNFNRSEKNTLSQQQVVHQDSSPVRPMYKRIRMIDSDTDSD